MTDIEFKYNYLGYKFTVKRKLPSSWDDINKKQLLAITKTYISNIDDNTFLAEFCNLNKHFINKIPPVYRYYITKQLKFLEELKPINFFIIDKYKNYNLPNPKLEKLSFGQFMFIDTFFSDYSVSNNKDDLDKFVASLLTPDNIEFDDNIFKNNLKFVKKIPEIIKFSFFLNYRLIKEWLTECYPLIFEKPDKKSNKKGGGGWLKIFDSIVGDDILRRNDYSKLSVHSVFKYLTKKIKEYAKAS